jgi:hypothetical protein
MTRIVTAYGHFLEFETGPPQHACCKQRQTHPLQRILARCTLPILVPVLQRCSV